MLGQLIKQAALTADEVDQNLLPDNDTLVFSRKNRLRLAHQELRIIEGDHLHQGVLVIHHVKEHTAGLSLFHGADKGLGTVVSHVEEVHPAGHHKSHHAGVHLVDLQALAFSYI